jgi:hypothetical protein
VKAIATLGCLALLLAACDDAAEHPADHDASLPDAAPDARVADAHVPDAAPDALPPDAAPPDAQPVDALLPDAAPDATPCIPADEVCNGVDDDCDGHADEGFPVGQPCGVGIGGCRGTATVVCAPDGTATCPADPGPPQPEACDGVDNDCDGLIDEDYDADGDGAPRCDTDPCSAPCPEGEEARCRALCDAQDCHDEDPTVFPAASDRCGDGIDQNCDGADAPCSVATGRIDALQIAAPGFAACPDHNGDGHPDNAFALLGGVANMALASAVEMGTVNLFLSAGGLAPPGQNGNFELVILYATAADPGSYALDPGSLDDAGAPRFRLPGARVRNGALEAGPANLSLSLPVLDFELVLTLRELHVAGTLAIEAGDAGNDGLRLTDGTLWGAVRDADLQAGLDAIEQACAAADPMPDACGPLANLRPALPNLLHMDQDLDGDGVLDSYSVCLSTGASPAVLLGWPP